MELINSKQIEAQIESLDRMGASYNAKVHIVGLSCLNIAARDGSIAPLNRFFSILSLRYQSAWKAYTFDHCRKWLTTRHGEFAIIPERMNDRQAFLELVNELTKENFLDLKLEKRERKPFDDSSIARRIQSLIKRCDRDDANVAPDVREILDEFLERIDAAIKAHEKRSRGRRKAVPVENRVH